MRTLNIRIATAVLLLGICEAPAAVLYVNLNSANPMLPYAGWATAATNIQDAVDAAAPGDVVLVTNGIYNNGGRPLAGYSLTNRVTVDKPITVQSVNGPLVTAVQGYQVPDSINGDSAIRCVYLANHAVLTGFTLTNGATLIDQFEDFDFHLHMGGGVSCEAGASVSNCIISGCAASQMGGGFYGDGGYDGIATNVVLANCIISGCQAGYGGGAIGGILNNCSISNNIGQAGGGAQFCVLNGCTVSSNTVELSGNGNGGGADFCTLSNCFLFNNSSDNAGGGASRSTLTACTLVSNSGFQGAGASDCKAVNCTFVTNFTSLAGGGAYNSFLTNCSFLGNSGAYGGGGADSSTLERCTLQGNTAQSGGGAQNSILINCFLNGNQAGFGGGGGGGASFSTLYNCIVSNNIGGGYGGGAWNCTVNNCLLVGNHVSTLGGGAADSTLNNCTVVGNDSAESGAGLSRCTANNCISYYNLPDEHFECTFNFSCTTPLPDGVDNITNSPLFVDANAGDFRLQSNSPCINSGNNTYSYGAVDLGGDARIAGGTVDIGAYEFQLPTSKISYAWLQQYNMSLTGADDFADPDQDRMNNYEEWIAGTDPTDSNSVLRLVSPLWTNSGVIVAWQSVTNRTYTVQAAAICSPDSFQDLATDLLGLEGITSFTDSNLVGTARFYRVKTGR